MKAKFFTCVIILSGLLATILSACSDDSSSEKSVNWERVMIENVWDSGFGYLYFYGNGMTYWEQYASVSSGQLYQTTLSAIGSWSISGDKLIINFEKFSNNNSDFHAMINSPYSLISFEGNALNLKKNNGETIFLKKIKSKTDNSSRKNPDDGIIGRWHKDNASLTITKQGETIGTTYKVAIVCEFGKDGYGKRIFSGEYSEELPFTYNTKNGILTTSIDDGCYYGIENNQLIFFTLNTATPMIGQSYYREK